MYLASQIIFGYSDYGIFSLATCGRWGRRRNTSLQINYTIAIVTVMNNKCIFLVGIFFLLLGVSLDPTSQLNNF